MICYSYQTLVRWQRLQINLSHIIRFFRLFFEKQTVVLEAARGTNFADISNINIQENHKLCIQIQILKCISWYNKKWLFPPNPPSPWAAPKKTILNRVKIKKKKSPGYLHRRTVIRTFQYLTRNTNTAPIFSIQNTL